MLLFFYCICGEFKLFFVYLFFFLCRLMSPFSVKIGQIDNVKLPFVILLH